MTGKQKKFTEQVTEQFTRRFNNPVGTGMNWQRLDALPNERQP